MVGIEGFELPMAESKSAALPLGDIPKSIDSSKAALLYKV